MRRTKLKLLLSKGANNALINQNIRRTKLEKCIHFTSGRQRCQLRIDQPQHEKKKFNKRIYSTSGKHRYQLHID